jgi:hypothetical protein
MQINFGAGKSRHDRRITARASMMSGLNLFTGKTQGSVSIPATAASARVALSKPAAATAIRVKNIDAANACFINFGNSTVVATVPAGAVPGSMPIGPGETAGFSVPENTTHVAAICSGAGTATIYFLPGWGV